MKKYLLINNINSKLPTFTVFNERGEEFGHSVFYKKIEDLVTGLKIFLKKQKISAKDLDGILVINGPGSWTSSRGAVTFANSFNFLFKIPVIGIRNDNKKTKEIILKNYKKIIGAKKNTRAEVFYDGDPNITIKK